MSSIFPPLVGGGECVVMTQRRTFILLMMVILLDFTTDIWTLPAPHRVFMDSVNMRHILRWPPLQAACNTTVLYDVQYQGEFELLVRNGSWMDAAECKKTPLSHCDLTFDLGSDSDYNLQVRAQCGAQLSAWTRLSRAFNRRHTVLTTPEMKVTTAGDALQVSIHDLPLTATASVSVWKKDELQVDVYEMPAEQKVLHVAALEEGAVYCVRAQIVLHSGPRSSSSDPHCVAIAGPERPAYWKTPTTVTLTAIVMLGFLFALFWSLVHCRLQSCRTYFHKEPLPQPLQSNCDTHIFRLLQTEEQPCELLSVITEVKASEPETTSGLEKQRLVLHSGAVGKNGAK